jgi:hypothetical protein
MRLGVARIFLVTADYGNADIASVRNAFPLIDLIAGGTMMRLRNAMIYGRERARRRVLTIRSKPRSRSPWMAFLVLRPAFHDQPARGRLFEHAAAAPSAAR